MCAIEMAATVGWPMMPDQTYVHGTTTALDACRHDFSTWNVCNRNGDGSRFADDAKSNMRPRGNDRSNSMPAIQRARRCVLDDGGRDGSSPADSFSPGPTGPTMAFVNVVRRSSHRDRPTISNNQRMHARRLPFTPLPRVVRPATSTLARVILVVLHTKTDSVVEACSRCSHNTIPLSLFRLHAVRHPSQRVT